MKPKFIFFFLAILGCTNQDLLEVNNKLTIAKKNPNCLFENWNIVKRSDKKNSSYLFTYYYKHLDSTKFENTGNQHIDEFSKYASLQFVVQPAGKSDYFIRILGDSDSTIDDINDFIVNRQCDSFQNIDYFISKFLKLDVNGITSYPWVKGAYRIYIKKNLSIFNIDSQEILARVKEEYPNIKKVSGNWYWINEE